VSVVVERTASVERCSRSAPAVGETLLDGRVVVQRPVDDHVPREEAACTGLCRSRAGSGDHMSSARSAACGDRRWRQPSLARAAAGRAWRFGPQGVGTRPSRAPLRAAPLRDADRRRAQWPCTLALLARAVRQSASVPPPRPAREGQHCDTNGSRAEHHHAWIRNASTTARVLRRTIAIGVRQARHPGATVQPQPLVDDRWGLALWVEQAARAFAVTAG